MAESAGDADTVDGFHADDLEESSEIDADIADHQNIDYAHHPRYTDTKAREAVYDITSWDHSNVIINMNADKLDGKDASEFASSVKINELEAQIQDLEAKTNKITFYENGDICFGNCIPIQQ